MHTSRIAACGLAFAGQFRAPSRKRRNFLAGPIAMKPNVTIQVADPSSQEIIKLLEELDKYLVGLYPPESNHILSVEALRQPNVVFLTAALDGHIVGCGGIVHQGAYAEIKRMF